jgi:hypothetical protein
VNRDERRKALEAEIKTWREAKALKELEEMERYYEFTLPKRFKRELAARVTDDFVRGVKAGERGVLAHLAEYPDLGDCEWHCTTMAGFREQMERIRALGPAEAPVPQPTREHEKCICAEGVTNCPRHGKQPAKRGACPLCGAPLGYCAEGVYCTKDSCKYVA